MVTMSNTPETLGEFLRSKAKHAKNTCERKGQISRVDGVCWFLSKVSHASPREIKRFVTAFKGFMSEYSHYDRKTRVHSTKSGVERCCSLLNSCYGGVGKDFTGVKFRGHNYGDIAPLYRPLPRTYALTIAGIHRAARVQDYINSR
jgi:hypothetical protein